MEEDKIPRYILKRNYEEEYWQTSDWLLPSQEPITDPCTEPDSFSPHPHNLSHFLNTI
jgi:hypothetical protein